MIPKLVVHAQGTVTPSETSPGPRRRYEYTHVRVGTLTDDAEPSNPQLIAALNDLDAQGYEVIAVDYGASGNYVHLIGRRKV